MTEPVNITLIAQRMGVSPGTVSRVLNGRNKENRPAIARRAEGIRRLAAELGYRPNAAARSMTSGRHGAMAFLACNDVGLDWIPLSLLHGIHAGLAAVGSRLVYDELDQAGFADPAAWPRLFRESAVDALLVYRDPGVARAAEQVLADQGIPHVWLNQRAPRPCVCPDEVGGGRLAVRRLIAAGCKSIGYFQLFQRPPAMAHYSERDRHKGVAAALAKAGLAAHRVLVGAPDYLFHQGQALPHAQRFLADHADCDGVVCYGPEEAVALQVAVAGASRRRSGALRLAVFAERPAPALTGTPVITVPIPFTAVGHQAVLLARDLLDGKDAERQVVVPYADDGGV